MLAHVNLGERDMPADAVVVSIVVIAAFVLFIGALYWAWTQAH